MELDRLLDLVADSEDRVERSHGLLENHGYAVSPHLPDPIRVEAQEVHSLKLSPPLNQLARRHGDKLQQGHIRLAPGVSAQERRGASLPRCLYRPQAASRPGRGIWKPTSCRKREPGSRGQSPALSKA